MWFQENSHVPDDWHTSVASRDKSLAIKIRVNAAGERSVGLVRLPPSCDRLSDLLNAPYRFITLFDARDDMEIDYDKYRVVAKEAVSYIEAVEEPDPLWERRRKGAFLRVRVQLSRPEVILAAELFVASGATMAGVLDDSRSFVSLRNVSIVESPEFYAFLAVGKAQLISVSHGHSCHAEARFRTA